MKLPAEVKTKWLKALRSGKYQQTVGTLCDNKGYCCLGVLQKAVEGKVEEDEYSDSGFRGEPSSTFWNRLGAEVDEIGEMADDENDFVKDKQLSRLMKMNDGMKWYDRKKNKMVQTRKRNFNNIADWIEKHVETL